MQVAGEIAAFFLGVLEELVDHGRVVLTLTLVELQQRVLIEEVINVLAVKVVIHGQVVSDSVLILRNEIDPDVHLASVNDKITLTVLIALLGIVALVKLLLVSQVLIKV